MVYAEADRWWVRYMGIAGVAADVVYQGVQEFWSMRDNEGMTQFCRYQQEVFPNLFARGSVHEGQTSQIERWDKKKHEWIGPYEVYE